MGTEIEDRIESAQYLAIVRKAFREWDQTDTQQKRDLIVHLITNAAGTRVRSDDILRLFLDWIELHHEAHFAVIREIYKNPGSTRYDIWVAVYGSEIPRDDSADADLFKMLIRDLHRVSIRTLRGLPFEEPGAGWGSRGDSMLPFIRRPLRPKSARSHRNTVASQRMDMIISQAAVA